MLAKFEGTEVKESECDRFLDLVCVRAGQHDPGNVCLKIPDLRGGVGKRSGTQQ